MDELTIAEAAQSLGLSVHALRYYERIGLHDPVARKGGQRRYGEIDLAWLRFIQRLRATGMGMRQIGEYARLRRVGESSMPERIRMLDLHLRELERRERELAEHRLALTQKIAAYRRILADAEGRAAPHAKTSTTKKRQHPAGQRNRDAQ